MENGKNRFDKCGMNIDIPSTTDYDMPNGTSDIPNLGRQKRIKIRYTVYFDSMIGLTDDFRKQGQLFCDGVV